MAILYPLRGSNAYIHHVPSPFNIIRQSITSKRNGMYLPGAWSMWLQKMVEDPLLWEGYHSIPQNTKFWAPGRCTSTHDSLLYNHKLVIFQSYNCWQNIAKPVRIQENPNSRHNKKFLLKSERLILSMWQEIMQHPEGAGIYVLCIHVIYHRLIHEHNDPRHISNFRFLTGRSHRHHRDSGWFDGALRRGVCGAAKARIHQGCRFVAPRRRNLFDVRLHG